MLSKKERIPRELFTSFRGGRLFHSSHFLLRQDLGGSSARIGVSVSKKVSKKAVVRNLVRRRAYSALAPLLPTLPSGMYVFSAKPGAQALKGENLSAELAELLKKS